MHSHAYTYTDTHTHKHPSHDRHTSGGSAGTSTYLTVVREATLRLWRTLQDFHSSAMDFNGVSLNKAPQHMDVPNQRALLSAINFQE